MVLLGDNKKAQKREGESTCLLETCASAVYWDTSNIHVLGIPAVLLNKTPIAASGGFSFSHTQNTYPIVLTRGLK